MESWEKLTNPAVLRENLISASVYISAYEMCREYIVSKPKDFFTDNWGMEGETLSEEYFDDVMSFNKSPLKASLLWFKEQGAIDDQDIHKFDKAREHRNEIVHNLPMFISDPSHEVNGQIFNALLEVTHKIGVFWVVNYELSISPEYDGKEIDEGGIQVGTIMMINMMRQIAFGQESEEGYFYNELKRRTSTKKTKADDVLKRASALDGNKKMKIRTFQESDKNEVIALWCECGLVVPQNDPTKDIERKLKVDPELFLVGLDENSIVAAVMGGYEGHRGWINYLAVKPSKQRKGYGQAIMQAVERLLKQRGCPKINLQVRTKNSAVIAFYAAIGYGNDNVVGLGKRLEHD